MTHLQIARIEAYFEKNERTKRYNGKPLSAYLNASNGVKVIKELSDSTDKYNRRHFNRLDYVGQKEYMERLKRPKYHYHLYISDSEYFELNKTLFDYIKLNYKELVHEL